MVLHDMNGNKKMDTNWVGLPKEGWGGTRNKKPTMRAPYWKEAKVTVGPEGRTETVIMRY